MNESYFRELLELYITSQISDADRLRFFELLQQDEYRSLFGQILKEEWERGQYEESANQRMGYLIEQYVLSKIMTPSTDAVADVEKGMVVRPVSFLRRYRMVAAAVLLFAVAGTAWLLVGRADRHDVEVAGISQLSIKSDIPPGTNGATLTLADGSRIVLDSSSHGMIATQGNTKLVQVSAGQLAYRPVGNVISEDRVFFNTLITDRGKQFHIELPDGTGVWLNAGSSLQYPVAFTGKQRKVTLTGEAYFEVAKNSRMPFVIATRDEDITVLGTHFNVNSYEDELSVRTTLLEGSVKITVPSLEGAGVVLRPGEQGIVTNNSIKVQAANINDVMAWKNGFFSFRHSGIREIMRQLSRWYDVTVSYEGTISDHEFTGKIDRNLALSEVLKILEQTRIHFKMEEGKNLRILPSKN